MTSISLCGLRSAHKLFCSRVCSSFSLRYVFLVYILWIQTTMMTMVCSVFFLFIFYVSVAIVFYNNDRHMNFHREKENRCVQFILFASIVIVLPKRQHKISLYKIKKKKKNRETQILYSINDLNQKCDAMR